MRAALAASEARAASAEADLAQVRAVVTTSEAMIRHLKLEIAKMRREQYGQSSERRARLIDQMELHLEELEADATEDEIAAERVAAKITNVSAFERRRPARKPFPAHLPRERLIIEAPSTCTCCGSDRIVKMGEDVTETLEAIPRQWKVIQTVREKFTCRDCEKISQSTGTFPCHAARMGGAEPACHDPVREVRPASALEPPGRALRQGRRRSQPLHAGRSGRSLCDGSAADP